MPPSRRQLAIRACSRAVSGLSVRYGLPSLGKDPTLDALLRWHRQLLKKVHPDKGGHAEDFRAALAAKVELDDALKAAASTSGAAPSPPGAPPTQPTGSSGQGAASASDGARAPLKRPAAPTTTARKRPASCEAPASGPAPPCGSSSRALVPLWARHSASCGLGKSDHKSTPSLRQCLHAKTPLFPIIPVKCIPFGPLLRWLKRTPLTVSLRC